MPEQARDADFAADVATDIDRWHHAVNPQFERLLEATGLGTWPLQTPAPGALLTPTQWTARLVTSWEELIAAQTALATAWMTPTAWFEPPSSSGSLARRTTDVARAAGQAWLALAPF